MASGDRMYFKEDVSVLSFDGNTGVMSNLGDGTIGWDRTEIENSALMDVDTDSIGGKRKWTFEGELACEEGDYNWLGDDGTAKPLVFTSTNRTISGNFRCIKANQKLGDAMRYNVSLVNAGNVTVGA
jgi:hypothetical protein